MGDSSFAGSTEEIGTGNFYLDFLNPANCMGFVSTVHYCYNNPPALAAEARIALYRRTGSTVNRVSEEFIITNHIPFSSSSGSACEQLELQTPISVNIGDMFGICLLSRNSSRDTLTVVSGTVSRVPACSDELVDSISIFSYSIFNDYTLHLSANVTAGMCIYNYSVLKG